MASAVLDILSFCLIGTSSWLTLPAAMRFARITISPFLDMYVKVLQVAIATVATDWQYLTMMSLTIMILAVYK